MRQPESRATRTLHEAKGVAGPIDVRCKGKEKYSGLTRRRIKSNILTRSGVEMNRRRFIVGCSLCGLMHSTATAQTRPRYCSLDSSFDTTNFKTMSSSGNRALDKALIAEVRKVNATFSIRPGYKYIDDGQSPNAFAHSATIVSNTRGTIFFGTNLIRNELSANYGGASVAGIAAHEGAHILQFFSSWSGELQQGTTAREMELHADLLAGYYFGRTGRGERSVNAFTRSLVAMGDDDFNDPHHHGTSAERRDAMLKGFDLSRQGTVLNDAIGKGIEHVKG